MLNNVISCVLWTVASQEYSPVSLITRGLRVSVEMNGDV